MAARFAHSWDVTDYEIERHCRYRDDAQIAGYFGITVERVRHVRSKMARPWIRVVEDQTAKSEEIVNASTRQTERKAEEGSDKLRDAITRSGQTIAPELPRRRLSFEEQLALVASGRAGIIDLGPRV